MHLPEVLFLALLSCAACLLPGRAAAQPTALLTRADAASGVDMYRLTGELLRYAPDDFSAADRARLTDLLIGEIVPHRDRLLLLAGYLDMAEALRAVPQGLLRTELLRRNHLLALVRAGDTDRRDQLLRSLRSLSYDDAFVYRILPLLVYTHDRRVYDYLIDLLLTDNRACRPADPHADGRIDCGYRLMEALAPVLVDFPFSVGPSGDLEVDDYADALRRTRAWLRAHRSDYRIVRDRY